MGEPAHANANQYLYPDADDYGGPANRYPAASNRYSDNDRDCNAIFHAIAHLYPLPHAHRNHYAHKYAGAADIDLHAGSANAYLYCGSIPNRDGNANSAAATASTAITLIQNSV